LDFSSASFSIIRYRRERVWAASRKLRGSTAA
jgi:hypothetical protein